MESAEVDTSDTSIFGEPRFMESVDIFITEGRASVTLLQNRLQIGYAHAARIVDRMAEVGIVSSAPGAKGRELLIGPVEWEEMKKSLSSPNKQEESGPADAEQPD